MTIKAGCLSGKWLLSNCSRYEHMQEVIFRDHVVAHFRFESTPLIRFMSNGFRDCSHKSLGCHTETIGSSIISVKPLSFILDHSALDPVNHFNSDEIAFPSNLCNHFVCHRRMCHKFISRNRWVWVKNWSPSCCAVSSDIIFTISRRESPTPIVEGR